mmetsp:Transcript_44679/g.54085  ORF Transcript_44679/g.54085 Transcript_44679/m.54085 type:complete len:268 (+) Transcript_44679:712-1515(+)
MKKGARRIVRFAQIHHVRVGDEQAAVNIGGARGTGEQVLTGRDISKGDREGVIVHGPALGTLPLNVVIESKVLVDKFEIGVVTRAHDSGINILQFHGFFFIVLSPLTLLLAPVHGLDLERFTFQNFVRLTVYHLHFILRPRTRLGTIAIPLPGRNINLLRTQFHRPQSQILRGRRIPNEHHPLPLHTPLKILRRLNRMHRLTLKIIQQLIHVIRIFQIPVHARRPHALIVLFRSALTRDVVPHRHAKFVLGREPFHGSDGVVEFYVV